LRIKAVFMSMRSRNILTLNEHIKPELVGNYQRILVSDLSGKSNVLRKAKEFNLRLDP